ncbi:DNA-directed RNA polymerase I subunit RPA49 family protein [Amycolatopsis vastitatis]|nr:DNA-directed RNA polymerase I subunit RPA49 family protein [Amycolatopsis vastitatis]
MVVDEGKSFGSGNAHVYCVGIHFPATGEVKFYDKSKVTTV